MATFTGFGSFSWNTSGATVNGIKPINDLAEWRSASINTSIFRWTYTVRGYDGNTYVQEVRERTFPAAIDLSFSVNGVTIGTAADIPGSWADVGRLSGQAFYERILSGSDVIRGGDGPDVLYGFAGDDSIYGNGGDDILYGGAGFDSIYGGSGTDTAQYGNDMGDYLMSRLPSNGSVSVQFKEGTSEYVHWDVERFQFRDGTLTAGSLGYYGITSPVATTAVQPIYRFFNTRDKAFFYTSSKFERDMVIDRSAPSRNNVDEWPYVYQGSTFEEAHTHRGAVAIERFYNTRTGHHFFTVSQSEADMVKGKIASKEWPFVYEGKAFAVYPSDPVPTGQGQEVAVRRFYSPSLDRHWFTADTEEINQIRLTGVWNDEGIAFWGEIIG